MHSSATYHLTERIGSGVYCGEEGLFVGGTPLLEAVETDLGFVAWRVRDPEAVGRDLSRVYGIPVDFRPKRPGVESVARALTRGDLALARVAALMLRLPDPEDWNAAPENGETKLGVEKQNEALRGRKPAGRLSGAFRLEFNE